MQLPPLNFATTNAEKLQIAVMKCREYGLELQQISTPDIPEIQGEDPRVIIEHKARSAYELSKAPIVVSDDSWNIPALNGFPGPYMKSINHWFDSEAFLRLMHSINDRRVYIQQYLAYADETTCIVFHADVPGIILTEVRGKNTKAPIMNVVALDDDKGMSIAEAFELGYADNPERYAKRPDAWSALSEWYKSYHGN